LEIDVQNLLLVGVPLHRTQQHRTGRLAVDDQVENRGVILFLANGVVGFVVVEFEVLRFGIAARNDGGNTTFAATAAARARTHFAARSGVEFRGRGSGVLIKGLLARVE